MAAPGPAQPNIEIDEADYGLVGSDLDAEGEDDIEIDYSVSQTPAVGLGEEDGLPIEEQGHEAEEDEDEDDDEENDDQDGADDAEVEDDFVGAVKFPEGQEIDSDEDVILDDASDADAGSVDDDEDDDSDKSSSSAESVAAEQWEDGTEGGEEAEAEVATRNNCIFCNQDEENDPSEEFEEYMACAVCGDNAHRQCARDAKSLHADKDAEKWRCPACVENALEPDKAPEPVSRRRSSASKFTRDLLPAQRGASRPGSHSVFNTLILDDDPLDGSRSLRKRKASTDEVEEPSKEVGKRRKKQSKVDSESEAPKSPSFASDDSDDNDERLGKKPQIKVDDIEDDTDAASKVRSSRSARSRRSKKEQQQLDSNSRIIQRNHSSLIVALRVDLSQLKEILPKKKRRRPHPPALQPTPSHARFASSHASHYATPFYSFHERENDELKSKPYGGILSEAEADTSKTLPLAADRAKFEEARHKAEEEWKIKTAAAEAESESKGRTSHKISGPPSKIKCINFGGYEIETWYAAPYPEEYSRNRVLYICEFCLKYMNSDYVAWRHKLKCPAKHPPGDEIYRHKSVSVFEVDGRKNPVYCQNLCLLAKLFLGSKTLYYDVEPFLFYIMTEYDELGCHFVGYFSKEKRPSSLNNVSCILTLPIHQRKGYGNLLIDFSYLLTRVERKTGSPEKPLSDMGLVSYRNYWRLVLSTLLIKQKHPLSITDISDMTGMTADDIVAALEALRALVRDPVTKTYALRLDHAYFKQCIEGWEAKDYVQLNPDGLWWTPYVMGRNNLAQYDHAPSLPTVAPRDDEEEEKSIVPEEGIQVQERAKALVNEKNGNVNGDSLHDGDQGSASREGVSHDVTIKSTGATTVNGLSLPTPGAKRSPGKGKGGQTPSTNKVDAKTSVTEEMNREIIPPTRYEVFPLVPGTISRRRGGWRGGIRKSTANTPTTAKPNNRRGTTLAVGQHSANGTSGGKNPRREKGQGLGKGKGSGANTGKAVTPSSRRTRSALDEGDPVMDLDAETERNAEEATEESKDEEECQELDMEETEGMDGGHDVNGGEAVLP